MCETLYLLLNIQNLLFNFNSGTNLNWQHFTLLTFIILLVIIYAEHNRIWGLMKFPLAPIDRLLKGRVRFKAKLKAVEGNTPRLSPISSTICAFWKLTFQKKYGINGSKHWNTMKVLYSEHGFMKLYDETAECFFIPSEAQLNFKKKTTYISHSELKELSSIYNDIELIAFNDSLNIRVIEEIIPLNDDLMCHGYLEILPSHRLPRRVLFGLGDTLYSSNKKMDDKDSELSSAYDNLDLRKLWEEHMLNEEKSVGFLIEPIKIRILSTDFYNIRKVPLRISCIAINKNRLPLKNRVKRLTLFIFIFCHVIV